MRYLLASCVLIVLHGQVRADDSLKEEARQHFERGEALYKDGHYAEAIGEFERARGVLPVPALDYDIAKALDHLGRWEAAIMTYKRFLSAEPTSSYAAEVVGRIRELEQRLLEPAVVPVAVAAPVVARSVVVKKPNLALRGAAWATGGFAVTIAAIGGGLLGSAASSYHSLQSTCSPNCATDTWSGIPAREYSGEALLGVAGALVVADAVLWILDRRHR